MTSDRPDLKPQRVTCCVCSVTKEVVHPFELPLSLLQGGEETPTQQGSRGLSACGVYRVAVTVAKAVVE